jgi:sialate O-acetylesterase
MESDPEFRPILDRLAALLSEYPDAAARSDDYHRQWREAMQQRARDAASHTQAREEARAAGRPLPPRPRRPGGPGNNQNPTVLYNAMIAPLIPYAIRGAIWYQGESNANRAYQYRWLFSALIRDWRAAWGVGDFPFLFVQLANYRAPQPEPGESAWAELREAQLHALRTPNTAMAVAIDLGEADRIHPSNKQDVGARLALAARRQVYGEAILAWGPLYDSMSLEGDGIRLHFRSPTGGLVAKGGDPLTGFAIAGEDRKFAWASARIEGDTVRVRHPGIARPVAVRYAWADNPVCNLYNSAGLPASPFRTDDWPGLTLDKR